MRWVRLAAALALLNSAVSFVNIWPTLAIFPSPNFSIDLAVMVLILLLVRRRNSIDDANVRRLAVVWVILSLGHYVDESVRSLYGREINLYWDLRFVPDVSAMFAFVVKRWLAAAIVVAAILVPVLLYFPIRWAFRQLRDALDDQQARPALGVAAVVVLLTWGAVTLELPLPPGVGVAEPVAPAYARAFTELAYEMSGAGVKALGPAPSMQSNFSRLNGADVLLVFIEAYGAISWDRPAFAHDLAPSRSGLERDILETGRSVVSTRVESTTFGGESWLAHISLLSGTEVRDQRTNVRLMAQDRDTLVKAFGRQGYRTLAIMPGLLRNWPQGTFYGFEDIYNLERLDYQGPPFGWWDINDQFALARVDALEIAPRSRRPVFAFFPTISTHAPFTPAPPYQKDWARILSADPYDQADLDRAWADTPDWTNLSPSYAKSLMYTYATVGGYLRLRADRDFVLILVGDHQPAALVTGANASWDVPVHVIARPGALVDRLRRSGFVEGLAPPERPLARMDTLLPILLDAFGDADDKSVSSLAAPGHQQ